MFCCYWKTYKNSVKVHEKLTFDAFYDKYIGIFIDPSISKMQFMRLNRYKRLFGRNIIKPGNRVIISTHK